MYFLIDKVIFSIAGEQENIYSLTSVLVEKEKRDGLSFLKMVSSDGHRLSIMEKDVAIDIDNFHLNDVTLIPKKGIHDWYYNWCHQEILRKENKENQTYKLVFIGALLFLISDSLLSLNLFYKPILLANVSIMLTYGFAQFLIVLGILKLGKDQ